MQVSLDHLNIAGVARVFFGNVHGGTEINRPEFRSIPGGIISKPAISTAGIQYFLAAKKFGAMWLHVSKEGLLPFFVHLGKASPFVPKTERGLDLRIIFLCSRIPRKQRVA